MNDLHVVYRVDHVSGGEQWSTYSYPTSIYVGGSTLDEVRAEFRDAVAFGLERSADVAIVEHLERPLIPGAYIRIALDRRLLAREEVADALRGSLDHELQREDFERRMPLTGAGDAVAIACVPGDRLGWIFGQMGEHDGVAVCTRGELVGTLRRVWWSYVAGPHAQVPGGRPSENLASVGLSEESTVAEFMKVDATATGLELLAV